MIGEKSFNKFKWRLRSWGKLFFVMKSLQNRSDGMAHEWFGFGLFCSTAEKRMARQRFAFDDEKCKYKITCQTLFNVIFTVNINFQKIRSWELSFLSSVNFLLLFFFLSRFAIICIHFTKRPNKSEKVQLVFGLECGKMILLNYTIRECLARLDLHVRFSCHLEASQVCVSDISIQIQHLEDLISRPVTLPLSLEHTHRRIEWRNHGHYTMEIEMEMKMEDLPKQLSLNALPYCEKKNYNMYTKKVKIFKLVSHLCQYDGIWINFNFPFISHSTFFSLFQSTPNDINYVSILYENGLNFFATFLKIQSASWLLDGGTRSGWDETVGSQSTESRSRCSP